MTLNFANLKQIDRRSVSIALHPQGRKSRVTISGDSAVEYEAGDDGNDKSNYSTFISK